MTRGILSCGACARQVVRVFNAVQSPMAATALPFRPARHYADEAALRPTSDAPQDLEAANAPESTIAKEAARRRLERAVNLHLDRLDDPWTIGKYVEKALARGAFEEAYRLVEKASKKHQLIVSWNYLIDHQLKQDKIKDAIKLYNDMKKRQQFPNDRTYTILFRGLAQCSNKDLAVKQTLKHYNILLKEEGKDKESAVEINNFHLNAALNVCARAGDIDALFTIANSINESSLAPTAYTYTTIFNALRYNAIQELEGLAHESDKTAKRSELINVARGLWDEVLDKWSRRKLIMDEDLVCSICRIFLAGPNDGARLEVLKIIEETMNIPNLVLAPHGHSASGHEEMKGIASGGKKPLRTPSRSSTYVIPGTGTLGIVLNVLDVTRHTRHGIRYWNLFVRDYGLEPDANNCLGLFYMLRTGRASADAAAVLEDNSVPKQHLSARLYRLAMQVCIKDNVNPAVMGNSTKIVNSMMETFTVPDPEVLGQHLDVALYSSHSFRTQARKDDGREAHLAYGSQIQEALGHIWEPYRQAHYHYFRGTVRPKSKTLQAKLLSDKTDVISLARRMSGAFHKILREKLIKEEDIPAIEKTFAEINKDIQDFNDNHAQKDAEPQSRTSTPSEPSNEGRSPAAGFIWKTYIDSEGKESSKRGPPRRAPPFEPSKRDRIEDGRPRRTRTPRSSTWEPKVPRDSRPRGRNYEAEGRERPARSF